MIRRTLALARGQRGFTLTEVLVAMIFIGVLFAVFATVVSSTLRHNDEISEQTTLQAEARAAIDQIAQDLRQAYTGDEAVAPIESVSATQITFLSANRTEPMHLRRVSYRLSSGALQRRQAISTDTDGPPWVIPSLPSWQTRVSSVVNSTVFTYYDADGDVTTTPADVVTVGVTLTVASGSAPDRRFTYQSSVSIREGDAS
jgi:prepilin-type N-terminal cleavage/methylation domain-containing protein